MIPEKLQNIQDNDDKSGLGFCDCLEMNEYKVTLID